jgi:N-acetylmuramoyl-L-alanine amidase
MPQVFLGVGHGITPAGAFDQGAQAPGRNEYEMNWRVVIVIAAALDRCGVSFFNEEAAGKGHDPDFAGSAVKANDLNVQLAIEVHHNASPRPHLGFGCEMCIHADTSERNRKLGRRIAALLHQELGLTIRRGDGLNVDNGLAFTRTTRMPAMIPEISFIDNATDRQISGRPDYPAKAGEAVAQAICEFFGKPYIAPHAATGTGTTHPATTHPATVPPAAVSPGSKLMAAPRGQVGQVTAYLLARPHGNYSADEVKAIAAAYFTVATPLGLDPFVAACQMIEETAHLSSSWSQPPRHNMAGIGVTGVRGEGVSFPSAREGVRAQLGRLLAFALKAGTETPAQRSLIEEALRFRPLSADHRGQAPTLGGLVGHWATDPQYAVTISRIASQVTGGG